MDCLSPFIFFYDPRFYMTLDEEERERDILGNFALLFCGHFCSSVLWANLFKLTHTGAEE